MVESLTLQRFVGYGGEGLRRDPGRKCRDFEIRLILDIGMSSEVRS